MPALPNSAMPSAPLNSEAVSDSAEAAPARSAGALVMMISLPIVNTGARPRPMMTVAGTSHHSPWPSPSSPKPTAALHRPTTRIRWGGQRAASCPDISEPTTKHSDQGKVASPARSGDSPSTSCRYCVMKM